MRKMKCSSGTALNTFLERERESRISVNNKAIPLAGTRLRQKPSLKKLVFIHPHALLCFLFVKTKTPSRQFIFLLYFLLDSKQPLFYLFHGGRENKGCHVLATHQISANINLWPDIWMVWCDITKWLESWGHHPKCLYRLSEMHRHYPVTPQIIFQFTILFRMLLQSVMLITFLKIRVRKIIFRNIQACGSLLFHYFPPNPFFKWLHYLFASNNSN